MDDHEIVELFIAVSTITPGAPISFVAILQFKAAINDSLVHDQLQNNLRDISKMCTTIIIYYFYKL